MFKFCLYVHVAKPSALREIDKEIQREYEAIHKVHMHLDDDHSGTVDKQESAEVSSSTHVLYSHLVYLYSVSVRC